MNSTLLIALALGMRHGTDPDHLTAIDGLSRIRPRVTNGLFFALGHGVVVTLLAVGIGGMISDRVAFLGPWVLILIGVDQSLATSFGQRMHIIAYLRVR